MRASKEIDMVDINAALVKKLRDLTGAGFADCKKALVECDGDIDKAVEWLRTHGAAKAAKRGAERDATNGLVAAADNVLIEVNCETDFVAKSDSVIALAQDIADLAASSRPADSAELAASKLPSGQTVTEAVTAISAVIGEKIELGRIAVFDAPTTIYLHRRSKDLPPQVGVLVAYEGDESAARAAAMQVAALRAQYVRRDDVPAEVVASERRIAEATAREEGKPEAAIPKITEGRVNGFFKDVVLVDQPSVHDSKKTVGQALTEAGTTVRDFARFEVGS